MKLTAKEIIGLNSLLDGKEIWGFYESVEPDMDISDKKRIAAKLLEYGEKGLAELLFLLNIYKNADDYVVINELNIALAAGVRPALLKQEDGYHFFIVENEQVKKYIKGKENIMFFRFRNNEIYGFNTLSTENGTMKQGMQLSEEIDELVERYLG